MPFFALAFASVVLVLPLNPCESSLFLCFPQFVCVYSTHARYEDFWRSKNSLSIYDTILHSSPKQLEAASTEKSLTLHMPGLEYVLLMCEDEVHTLSVQSKKLHEAWPRSLRKESVETACSKIRIQTQNIKCHNRLWFSYIFIQIAETYSDSISQTHFNTEKIIFSSSFDFFLQ